MKFFGRCRVLLRVLTGICVVLGAILLLRLITMIGGDGFSLISDYTNRSLLFFLFLFLLFIGCLTAVIVLKCIIRDAQEDFDAVLRYLKDTEGEPSFKRETR